MDLENKGGQAATFILPLAGSGQHFILAGTSGAGRSRLAEHFGLTTEEMDELLKPSPAQNAEKERRQAAEDHAASQRLQAVREAVWSTRHPNAPDLDVLHDALSCLGLVDEPSDDQQRALFDLLPPDIIGQGIAWGFSDTEVRDSIYTFAEENLQTIAAAVLHKNV